MNKTISLCFSRDGLLNPHIVDGLKDGKTDTVILFGDGSEEAYQHMLNFHPERLDIRYMALAKTPRYEMRVIHPDGTVSKPHFVLTEDLRIEWICAKICTHYLAITLSGTDSTSTTQVKADPEQTRVVCNMAYRFWASMLVAEEHLCFPAAVINQLMQFKDYLTPETLDIKVLRELSGLTTLEYNHHTDLLSVLVAGDLFSVKLSVLYGFYGELVFPLFNTVMRVSILGATGQAGEPQIMSYGELGRIVTEMQSYAKVRKITTHQVIDPTDLVTSARRIKINGESCRWPAPHQTIGDVILAHHDDVVHLDQARHLSDANTSSSPPSELVNA